MRVVESKNEITKGQTETDARPVAAGSILTSTKIRQDILIGWLLFMSANQVCNRFLITVSPELDNMPLPVMPQDSDGNQIACSFSMKTKEQAGRRRSIVMVFSGSWRK